MRSEWGESVTTVAFTHSSLLSAHSSRSFLYTSPMDVLLANPRGFCAGVDRAIEIVKRAIETLGAPIYVRHEVVHNKFVSTTSSSAARSSSRNSTRSPTARQ